MEQEKLNSYSARITNANRSQLVVITYEIIEDSVLSAQKAYSEEKWIEYEKDLKRVQKILHELLGSLDFQFEISRELLSLYQFCGKCIAEALFQRKTEKLKNVLSVMKKLRIGFEEVALQDRSPAVMQNTQTIYAGLTYGKHALNEVYVNVNEATRGFRA